MEKIEFNAIVRAIELFLAMNGFTRNEKYSYINNGCNVVITHDGFEVADASGTTMYSKDHNIYWLIGILTYYNHIPKNYKTEPLPKIKFYCR